MELLYNWLLQKLGGLVGLDVASILLIVGIFNTGLMLVQVIVGMISDWLETFKDKTETQLDNKFYGYLGKASGLISSALKWLSKALDLVGANKQHK